MSASAVYTDLEEIWTASAFPSLKELFLKNFKVPDRAFPTTTSDLRLLLLEKCQCTIARTLTAYSHSSLKRLAIIAPDFPIEADVFLERLVAMPSIKAIVLNSAIARPTEPLRQIALPDLRLDTFVSRWSNTAAQEWLVQQEGLIRLNTMTSWGFGSDEQDRYLEGIVATFRKVVPSPGVKMIRDIDIIEEPGFGYQISFLSCMDNDHYSAYIALPPAERPGSVEFSVKVHMAKSILDVLTYLNVDSTLSELSTIRVYRREDYMQLGLWYWAHELPLELAQFIAKVPSLKDVQLRAPFEFIQSFLSSCVTHRQGSEGFQVLETVMIETEHPPNQPVPTFDVVGLDDFRKPIQALIMTESSILGGYGDIAERVVGFGTELHQGIGWKEPRRLPMHPLDTFDGFDVVAT